MALMYGWILNRNFEGLKATKIYDKMNFRGQVKWTIIKLIENYIFGIVFIKTDLKPVFERGIMVYVHV